MKFLKRFLFVLSCLALVLALVGFLLPASAHVERSTRIQAGPDQVFAVVNSMKAFNQWSPWFALDPSARYTFSGPDSGVGSKMTWVSEKPDVGSGEQEILKSEPPSRVEVRLDFGQQGSATAYYRLEPDGDGTRVTWGFDSPFGMNLIGRYMGLLMDRLLGPDYEKGLSQLKAVLEAREAPAKPAGPPGSRP